VYIALLADAFIEVIKMISLIEDNRVALEELCSKFFVMRLEVFGSAVIGRFDPKSSDLDFLVEFQTTDRMNPADQYFGLLESLQKLFTCHVDLVSAKAIKNPYFLKSINQTKQVFYAA